MGDLLESQRSQNVKIVDEAGDAVTVTSGKLDVNTTVTVDAVKIEDATSGDKAAVLSSPTTTPTSSDKPLLVKSISSDDELDADGFTESTINGEKFIVGNKGGFNEFKLYPKFLSENMEDNDTVVATIDGTTTDVVQIFRASSNNVNSIHLVLQSSVSTTVLDDFESYANEAALDAEWVQSDSTNTPASLETTTVHAGSQSMKIKVHEGLSNGDTVKSTFTAVDLSAAIDIKMWVYNKKSNTDVRMKFHLGDGTNSSSSIINVTAEDTWEEKILTVSLFTADGASLPDYTAITEMWFEVDRDGHKGDYFVDDIGYVVSADAEASISLYDFGATSAPASLSAGTQMTLDNGNTTVDIDLGSVKSLVDVGNLTYNRDQTKTAMTIGNYYGIRIDKKSGADIKIYGSSVGTNYSSANAFTSTDSNTLTDASKDIFFNVFVNRDAWITNVIHTVDADAGSGELTSVIEDPSNEKILKYLVNHTVNHGRTVVNWNLQKPYELLDDNKIEFFWNDDGTSLVSELQIVLWLRFKPVTLYG